MSFIHSPKKWLSKLVVVTWLVFFTCLPAHSLFFGNYGLRAPVVGWMGFDSSMKWANEPFGKKWGVTDNLLLGVAHLHSISYQLWWVNEFTFGTFGKPTTAGAMVTELGPISLNGSTGLRYNLLDLADRPFIGIHLHYLHFVNAGNSFLTRDGRIPIWIGIRPEVGYEFFIGDELSLQAEFGYALFINFVDPFLQSMTARLSFNMYF